MNTTTIEKVELWQQRVADYQACGLTATAWCKQHGLNIHTLRYWIKKLNDESLESSTPNFIQLIPKVDPTPQQSAIVLRVAHYHIDVAYNYDESTLLRLLETLKKC